LRGRTGDMGARRRPAGRLPLAKLLRSGQQSVRRRGPFHPRRSGDDGPPLAPPGSSTGGHFMHGISGVSASAVCKPSSVPIDAEAPSGDGHPSEAAGRPTAHAADPKAGQRASPPAGRPARVAPSYLALLRVEFARFTPPLTPGSVAASSLWHWSSSRDGRVLPATLRCGARTFLTPPMRVTPIGVARPSDRLADWAILRRSGSTTGRGHPMASNRRGRRS